MIYTECFLSGDPYQGAERTVGVRATQIFYSAWTGVRVVIVKEKVISNSLNIDFLHGHIHSRSCIKEYSGIKFWGKLQRIYLYLIL